MWVMENCLSVEVGELRFKESPRWKTELSYINLTGTVQGVIVYFSKSSGEQQSLLFVSDVVSPSRTTRCGVGNSNVKDSKSRLDTET